MAEGTTHPSAPLSLRTRSRWVIGLLALTALADANGLLASIAEVGLYDDLIAGADIDLEEAEATDNRYMRSGVIQLAALLATGVAFLAWFWRAYSNIPRLDRVTPRYRRGWSIGSWFVPILNLFRPKQMMNDVWRASSADQDPTRWQERKVPPIVNWWWALWIVVSILDRYAGQFLFGAETIDDERKAALRTALADGAGILLDLVSIAMVVAVTRNYERRRQEILDDPPVETLPPAPGGAALPGGAPPEHPPADAGWAPPVQPVPRDLPGSQPPPTQPPPTQLSPSQPPPLPGDAPERPA